MATVNKASPRSEFDALKGRFEALCAAGGMSPGGRALFEALLMLFGLLMAVFMERNTPKGSGNSGLPSSKAEPDATARRRPGAKGKGPTDRAAGEGPTRLLVERRTAPVTACRACGRDLRRVAPTGHERRVLVDIVFETRETTVEAEFKTCPRCRTETRGAFPDDMPAPLRYGHGVVAFATHLLAAQMVPLKRTAQTLKALTGRAVAEATLLAWPMRLHHAPADREAAAVERLPAMPAPHADETGLRIDRQGHWPHTVGAGGLTVKFVHRRRGRAAIDAIGVIPRHGGVLVHDRPATSPTATATTPCAAPTCCATSPSSRTPTATPGPNAWPDSCAKPAARSANTTPRPSTKPPSRPCASATEPSSPKPGGNSPKPPNGPTGSAGASPKPTPGTSTRRRPNTKPGCSASPATPTSPSPTTAPSATSALRWSRFVGQSEGGTKVYSEGFCALDERNLPTRTDDVNGIVEASVVVV